MNKIDSTNISISIFYHCLAVSFPDAVDIFISTRFAPGNPESHERAKQLYQQLIKPEFNLKPFLVDANAGDDICDMVMHCLEKAKVFLIIGCDNYGALSECKFSTFYELKYAYLNERRIIVIQLCQDWPPKPSPDINGRGAQQNTFMLPKSFLNIYWADKPWDAAACAKEVSDAFHSHFVGSAMSSPPEKALLQTLQRFFSILSNLKRKKVLTTTSRHPFRMISISSSQPALEASRRKKLESLMSN